MTFRFQLSGINRNQSPDLTLFELARRTLEWPQPEQAGGHVEFFVERLIDNENMVMEEMS